MRSGWLTSGPQVKTFEEEFAKSIGARYAIAVNSGTAALHLALDSLGLKEGDEVLVPTMTFAATAEVVLYFRATPVLIDCRLDTLTLDPCEVEKAITRKTKAVIPVHYGGHPCEMDQILKIASAHRLKVVEDAAHALGACYRERMVGTIGDIACFSFYATKPITTGEGGMITTDNGEYADRMRIVRLHGISTDAWKRHAGEASWYYEVLYPGYKYNLTDIAAAIGIQQLKKRERFESIRRRYATLYNEGFADIPEITVPHVAEYVRHAWHLYVIQLDLKRLRITRNEFIERLRAKNIGGSVHFIPLHLHPLYLQAYGYRPEDFPRAHQAFERIVSLPLYPKMSEADAHDVIGAVRAIVSEHRR